VQYSDSASHRRTLAADPAIDLCGVHRLCNIASRDFISTRTILTTRPLQKYVTQADDLVGRCGRAGDAIPHFLGKGRVSHYYIKVRVKNKARSFICLLNGTKRVLCHCLYCFHCYFTLLVVAEKKITKVTIIYSVLK